MFWNFRNFSILNKNLFNIREALGDIPVYVTMSQESIYTQAQKLHLKKFQFVLSYKTQLLRVGSLPQLHTATTHFPPVISLLWSISGTMAMGVVRLLSMCDCGVTTESLINATSPQCTILPLSYLGGGNLRYISYSHARWNNP